jgi:hypothetical protein
MPPCIPSAPRQSTVGNVLSYDRTEVLLSTFAWWSDDDGATAAFVAAGYAPADDRLEIGFIQGRPAAIMRRISWRT